MTYKSIFDNTLFANQVILVTGGGSGIGRCVAFELASLMKGSRGGVIVVAGRKAAKLEKTRSDILSSMSSLLIKIDCVSLNIRDSVAVNAAIQGIVDRHGRIDGVVNNAGGQFVSPAENITDKGWNAVVETNLTGTFNVCRAVFPFFERAGKGSIVNIVSEMFNGFPLMAHSSAARAAVVNLTQTLAVEWGPKGIRINAVAPGTLIGNGMNNYPDSVLDEVFGTTWQNPSGRLGLESEISSAIVFLLSPGASYINGATLRVDGGSSLANVKANPLFVKEAQLNIYNGMPKEMDNELSQRLKQERDMYEERSKRRVSSKL